MNAHGGVTCELRAAHDAVRRTLRRLRPLLVARMPTEAAAAAELVLAEALNNVVEHAYDDRQEGEIMLWLDFRRTALHLVLRDRGRALGHGPLPGRHMPVPGAAIGRLPEGGWGWVILRRLTRNLRYERREGENILSCSLPYSTTLASPCALPMRGGRA